ncbi:MAG: TIGR01212 family radical SAM protein, partial [Thiobacillus sp.]|nr:TIGR01212 family radical SAM protein [Thiobacillus sp.]
MSVLTDYIHTFGRAMLEQHGERVHKIALDAGFTCPNRDGSKGIGGCTFCNNKSFAPGARDQVPLADQFERARGRIAKGTGARRFIAYFQAYTNTYAHVDELRALYDAALEAPDVMGLSIGTRPDCVPPPVLDLLAEYRERGHEVWLELGLQSAFDATLVRVNRGHGFAEYEAATRAARTRGIPVCCHLIVGLPGEDESHSHASLDRVLEVGVDGLKLHPL